MQLLEKMQEPDVKDPAWASWWASLTPFEQLWEMQETWYKDRELMKLGNIDPMYILKRIDDETKECREAVLKCIQDAGADNCFDLLTDNIRQEIADIFTFTLALARNIGLNAETLIADAKEKIGRNTGRYMAGDFKDPYANFQDRLAKSRREDHDRQFTDQFYKIPA